MKYTIDDLAEMLTYPRPAFSKMEEQFITKYIDSVPGIKKDTFGNRYIKVGKSDMSFTCHTDTVHRAEGVERQVVQLSEDGWAFKKDGDILGADDTTGVWLCLNLLYKKIPGLYIFHRAEEVGGRGSSFIANKTPQLLKGINKVLSLDRKDYHDVIIWQRGRMTASEEFGNALAKQLGHGFRNERGVFTDSANYDHIVPECANLSVGYFRAHSADELQDLKFAEALSNWLSNVNWNALPVKRDKTNTRRYLHRNDVKPKSFDDYWGYKDMDYFWNKR